MLLATAWRVPDEHLQHRGWPVVGHALMLCMAVQSGYVCGALDTLQRQYMVPGSPANTHRWCSEATHGRQHQARGCATGGTSGGNECIDEPAALPLHSGSRLPATLPAAKQGTHARGAGCSMVRRACL
jgi:hypothetical protein